MEKLFAAIDAEEARAPRRERSFDLGGRISELLASLTPRTLAWSAAAAIIAIFVQAVFIAAVVVKEQGVPSGPGLATAPSDRAFGVVRVAPQAPGNRIACIVRGHNA